MRDTATVMRNRLGLSPLTAQALHFTEVYRKHRNDPVAIREAMCLKAQYPALLAEIQEEDLFAGRRPRDRIAYVGTIWWAAFPRRGDAPFMEGKQGGYCFDFSAPDKHAKSMREQEALEQLADFWKNEYTGSKILAAWDGELKRHLETGGQISGLNVGFAIAVDLDKLVRKGIPGLIRDVEEKSKRDETGFYQGLRIALEVLIDACRFYERQALEMAGKAAAARDRARLESIARTLAGIVDHCPRTFREAMQLVWMYTLLAGGKHPEASRLDVALGDLYANDIDRGMLTEYEALEMILSLWRLYNENGDAAVCRIIIGGVGRRNEANADRFALAAMEATGRHKRVTPQLALRFHGGQNPQLLKKAFETINRSCTYPMLYNDDVIVPGIMEMFGVTREEAVRYHPLGCGEYMLAGCSPSMLDFSWNVPKSLEAALHNGSSSDGARIGPETGPLESLDTYEKLLEAFVRQADHAAALSARAYKCIAETMPGECAFLFASLLLDDCLERGRSLFDGGVRYVGACTMGQGFTNAADALTSIRKLVYRDKRFTLERIVKALDTDFEGEESLRKALLDAPKYGNDLDEADRTVVEVWRAVQESAKEAGTRAGLDFHAVSCVNPGGYGMGQSTGATADGRKKGRPYAIGNSPTAGFDRNGLPALFNSVSKVGPAHGGLVTNFKISRELFTGDRDTLEALFQTFFKKGGMQANITIVNREDLEAALREPEKYPHVLVRLGGWTARFIDLERPIQEEIIRRTMY